MSSLQQNWKEGQDRFYLESRRVEQDREGVGGLGEEIAQTIYAHVNK
jgi:hypothetical protein